MKKLILSLSLFSLGAYGLTTTEYGSKNLASEVYAQTKKDLSPSLSKLEAYYAQKLTKTGLSKEQKENLQKALEFAKNYHLLKMDKFKQDRIAYLKSIYANGKQKAGESYPEVKEKSQKLVQVAQGLKSGVPLKVENNIDVILTSTKAAEKAEADKLAAAKAEADKLAAAKAEADKLAAAKAEADKLAAAKAEADKLAAAKAEADKLAAAKAEADKLAAAKAEADKLAAVKAEADKLAAAKAEADKLAAAQIELSNSIRKNAAKYNQVAVDSNLSCALLDNSLYCWGFSTLSKSFGVQYNLNNRHIPVKITNFDSLGVVKKIAVSNAGYCVLSEDGIAECQSINSSSRYSSSSLDYGVQDIALSNHQYCIVKSSQLFCGFLYLLGTNLDQAKSVDGAKGAITNLTSLDQMVIGYKLNYNGSSFCYNIDEKVACHGDIYLSTDKTKSIFNNKSYFLKDKDGVEILNAKIFSLSSETTSIYNKKAGFALVNDKSVYSFMLQDEKSDQTLSLSYLRQDALSTFSEKLQQLFMAKPSLYKPINSIDKKVGFDLVGAKKWTLGYNSSFKLAFVKNLDDEFAFVTHFSIENENLLPKNQYFEFIPFFKWSNLQSLASSSGVTCALLKNNEIFCHGDNTSGALGERYVSVYENTEFIREGIANYPQFKKIKINEALVVAPSLDTCLAGELRFQNSCMGFVKKFSLNGSPVVQKITLRKDLDCKETIGFNDPFLLTSPKIADNYYSAKLPSYKLLPYDPYPTVNKVLIYPAKDYVSSQKIIDDVNKLNPKVDALLIVDVLSCGAIETTKSESKMCNWDESRNCHTFTVTAKDDFNY